ncbi:MAG: glycosyltransferase family 2 protein [Deltaproteobacteria bacterium]|jgi:dolichol-phosphate mannosyltransferase|nr:glycosyltransferase family 2 protein [Deltaproteobacteria bacterium]MBT6435466.1 glycosyltransferase family 2 protein [Deltaproteobacteria bacterium]MBT6492443.1 glycosyltransferase family 2 protein [Deltaproteobacteria bacterium]
MTQASHLDPVTSPEVNTSYLVPSISLIIPAHNESRNLLVNIPSILKAARALSIKQIIVVNDGSTDTTKEDFDDSSHPLLSFIHHPTNLGQSAAIASGLKHVTTNHVMFLDGDFQIELDTIRRMIQCYQLAVAQNPRKLTILKGQRTQRPAHRAHENIIRKSGNRLLRLCTGLNIPDFGCTTAIYPSKLLRELPKNLQYFHRYLPIIARANALPTMCPLDFKNFRYREIPRRFGQSHYRVTKFLGAPYQVLRILQWAQKYSKSNRASLQNCPPPSLHSVITRPNK